MEQFRTLSMTLFYLFFYFMRYVMCTFFTFLLLWHAFCHATNKRIWWWWWWCDHPTSITTNVIDDTAYSSASAIFCLSELHLVISPEFHIDFLHHKTRVPGYPVALFCFWDPTFSCFDTIPACDRWTDRRTHDDSKYHASIVSCG